MKIIKKICLLSGLIFMLMFVGMFSAKAINMTTSSTEVFAGDKFTINFSDATISDPSKLLYEFSYDNEDKLERENPVGFVGSKDLFFKETKGSVVYKTKEVKANYVVTFKIIDRNNSGDIKTVSVNVKTKQTTTTTTTTTTPTTTTQAVKSSNANLKTLEIKTSDDSNVVLSPIFSSNVYEYSASVDSSIKTITISATMEDSKSNMVISNNATEELKPGENNKITITVTAEDGTKKAYVINIKREALTADATLKSLTIKECEDFEFVEDTYSYDLKLNNSVTKLTIDYVTSSSDSIVSISGNENLKNGSKVKILVTAEDGTKKEYILNVIKETKTTKKSTINVPAEKNPLIIMFLSMVAFGLIGGIIYANKKKG